MKTNQDFSCSKIKLGAEIVVAREHQIIKYDPVNPKICF